MIVAMIALAVSLGGSAYAVKVKLKPKQVKTGNIADDAVTGQKANEATFGTVPNASNAANAANAANATNATNAVNANSAGLLDGIDSAGFVQSFGGHVAEQSAADVFTVPQLDVSILAHPGGATSSQFRVRNDSTTVGVDVTVSADSNRLDTLFTVGPSTTSTEKGGVGPFYLTSDANPDLMLIFDCGFGQGATQIYCWGGLVSTPNP